MSKFKQNEATWLSHSEQALFSAYWKYVSQHWIRQNYGQENKIIRLVPKVIIRYLYAKLRVHIKTICCSQHVGGNSFLFLNQDSGYLIPHSQYFLMLFLGVKIWIFSSFLDTCNFYLSKGNCIDCIGLHVTINIYDNITFAFFWHLLRGVKEPLEFCYYLCPLLTCQSQQAGNTRHLVPRSQWLYSSFFKIEFNLELYILWDIIIQFSYLL